MSEINDGGPAFPQLELDQSTGNIHTQHFGMTLRDYFAAKAMQGICANEATLPTRQEYFDNIANDAFRLADAMLKAREL